MNCIQLISEKLHYLKDKGIETSRFELRILMEHVLQLKAGQTLDGAFCDHLKKYCILAVPGKGFGKQDYFRLAYCVSFDSIINSKEPFAKAMAEW